MNEHELCCGTVANKARLCAEIEQRDLIIAAQQRHIIALEAALEAGDAKVKLTAPGQIKRGCKIHCTHSGKPQTYQAKEILNAWTDKEEVLLNIKKNLYFITSMAIDGSSWAKDVYFEPALEAANAPNP